MDKEAVLLSLFKRYLSYSFEKRLAFYVSYCSADFSNYHICITCFAYIVNKFLDLISNMRNHLNCTAKIFTFSLLVQNIPVDFACSQIGISVEILIYESFVMPEIEIGFSPILSHIYLSMLIRAHCTRIHIDVRIQLLSSHLKTSGLQQPSKGSCSYPFTET